ncbi:phospholipase D family protein [Umboniibacter marinipuniceus]|uniref:Putative cardiolipin synthase n=1 Tax=Umboniibacter marinipuniceus TaxID=569599 RepID=A0A3M0A9H7_9GAMM|nr:phospholipase D family protein [Umboniibacter marinipuniceus]RMA80149.1 putative cardiolipin synthase [Umboniibacter marinipuniceus]
MQATQLFKLFSYILFLSGFVCLTSCRSLPPADQMNRTESFAIGSDRASSLSEHVSEAVAARPDQSGFMVLAGGVDSFVARMKLIESAEISLDVQYYIWHSDSTGLVLANALIDAADRGVRVRLLLDDLDTSGKDLGLSAINQHPNIEVRVYNPFANRSFRLFESVSQLNRVNHRMHNKSLTADGQVTIVGGRNIGNEYFNAEGHAAFADLDVLSIGPVVAKVSDAFDSYWNSPWVYPFELIANNVDQDTLAGLQAELTATVERESESNYAQAASESKLLTSEYYDQFPLYWGKAEVLYDAPNKAETDSADTATHVGANLANLLRIANRDILIISAYFVPTDHFVQGMKILVESGVRVRILTNSLAANDVGIVHAGYMNYREALVEAGVELYEFKPNANRATPQKHSFGSSRASLHAKTFTVDERYMFVGSFNLDPRSMDLNTEMGVLFESTLLAERVSREFDESILNKAYRVELDENQALRWRTTENGEEITFEHEPEVGFFRRISVNILSYIVIESWL